MEASNQRKTLALLGVGAMGEFILPYLSKYFDLIVYDAHKELSMLNLDSNTKVVTDLNGASKADIIVLATPVATFASICEQLSPLLRSGQLVMDVGSVKSIPAKVLSEHLPDEVDIVGLHPLFGPQSGKEGIEGLPLVVCPVRGDRADRVAAFAREDLKLKVIECSASEHDEQMAYVQGLTHMVAKVFQKMQLPEITQETKTFGLLRQMVDTIKYDSDELFRSIQNDNPFVDQTKSQFFQAVKELEDELHRPKK